MYRAIILPFARILCCCCRRDNASPAKIATDSHEVAFDENNSHPTVMLLTHTSTLNNVKTDPASKSTILITQTDEKTTIPLIVQNNSNWQMCE